MKKKKPITQGVVKKEAFDALTRQLTQMPRIKLKDIKKRSETKKGG